MPESDTRNAENTRQPHTDPNEVQHVHCIQVEGSTVGDDVGVVVVGEVVGVVVGEVVGVVVFPVNSNNGMIERTHTTQRNRHNRQKDTKEMDRWQVR